MGLSCNTCLKKFTLASELGKLDIERMKKRSKGLRAMNGIVKIQSLWRSYKTRKVFLQSLLSPQARKLLSTLPPFFPGFPLSSMRPVFSPEGVYIGEHKESQKHGRGLRILKNGSIYIGHWEQNEASGQGRLIHSEGDYYEGNWLNNKAEGQGIYVHSDGLIYKGN